MPHHFYICYERGCIYPKQKIYAWLKIKKVEHMKGGIMCHPRSRKSSTADQRKHEKTQTNINQKASNKEIFPFKR